ncbi:MAG: DNA polymerase beta superfamily protein, partial [Candidatus Levyibacteriota bacterium]
MDKMQILKVIVGSQAHGLATQKSDTDYRGVFVIPTSELLKLGNKVHFTSWNEGSDDDTSWELGHFLNLAIHCNPTILETFLAPTDERSTLSNYGKELRELFPFIWNSADVKAAFIGYGIN